MHFTDYQNYFTDILEGKVTEAPYNDTHYLEYTKLNASRQNRWLKKGILLDETLSTIQSINSKQRWLLITEPWCGDASHCVPFIVKMAELNPLIDLEIQLRDGKDSEINSYLTNGGKSIPILVARDTNNQDLFVWGPRPIECQKIFTALKDSDATFEEQKIVLQQWYNENHGVDIQKEICERIQNKKVF